jgi:hypothetical protein
VEKIQIQLRKISYVCINETANYAMPRNHFVIIRASEAEVSQIDSLAKLYGSRTAAIRKGLALLVLATSNNLDAGKEANTAHEA